MAVIVMRGIPGSGKSTYVRKNFPDAIVFSADDYFMHNGEYKFNPKLLGDAHGWCLRKFVTALQNSDFDKRPLVVDNTNIKLADLAPYCALAEAYGHSVCIVSLYVDPVRASQRNVHGVPASVVHKMAIDFDKEMRAINGSRWPLTYIAMSNRYADYGGNTP